MLVIESTDLSWIPETQSFFVEASRLEDKYRIDRLDYENGKFFLHVRSHRTGNLAKFYRMREIVQKGELLEVEFSCSEHGGIILIIAND